MKKGMIKLSVFFPGEEDTFIDLDYFLNKHMPKVLNLLGDKISGSAVEKGISGGAPGSFSPYVLIMNLYFEDIETYQACFIPVAGEILADVNAFTDSKPLIQISEVIL